MVNQHEVRAQSSEAFNPNPRPVCTDPGLLPAMREEQQLAKKWRARWMARQQMRAIVEAVREAA